MCILEKLLKCTGKSGGYEVKEKILAKWLHNPNERCNVVLKLVVLYRWDVKKIEVVFWR